MTASNAAIRWCAVYTRKSSEEGLEQQFNSLHAQREAAEASIKSQRHEGWRLLAEKYDDGGYSGGNLERPALKRLVADIRAGKVQTVVVYKVDRLTRSLSDFAKLIELFEARGVTFVSVTQQFNTTTSMGRLMLNVPANQLVPGDVVFLEQGDNVPADCRLIEAFGVRVNNATVTAESLPQARKTDPSEKEEILRGENILPAGTSMASGEAKAIVFATGMHTEFGKIAHLSQTGREAVSPLRQEVAHLSRLIGILAVVIGLTLFVISRLIGVASEKGSSSPSEPWSRRGCFQL